MMLRLDEDLVEAAVFLCVTGKRRGVPAAQIARFHRERERLYAILDPDERNRAFFQLHHAWFCEWGFECVLAKGLEEFPQVTSGCRTVAFRQARGPNEEGAELYVNDEGQRHALVALRTTRWETDTGVRDYLRHELMHLSDMVDAEFGYSPRLDLPGQNACQQRLTRERYRLLWDVTIDGRLTQAGHAILDRPETHRAGFDRAFSFWPEVQRVEVFNRLWKGRTPRHADLLALAADPREVRRSQQPLPGALCPLCDFPTFAWSDPGQLAPGTVACIESEFPAWTRAHGLCGRCAEAYQVAAQVRGGNCANPGVSVPDFPRARVATVR